MNNMSLVAVLLNLVFDCEDALSQALNLEVRYFQGVV
jgi:hypothetical protein